MPNFPEVAFSVHSRRSLFVGCFVLLAACFAEAQRGLQSAEKQPLVVCAVPDAMPRTGRAEDDTPRGLDVAVAQRVAQELDREIEWHWCASDSCSWNCLENNRCDMVIGQPQGSRPPIGVSWSIPYSGSRFGFVVHQKEKGIRSLGDLRGKRVGVVAGTVALSASGHTTVRFKTRAAVLQEFENQKLDAAFVDDDFAAWYLHEHPRLPLRRVPEYVPRERWNLGFAVRAKDDRLLVQVDRALRRVLSTGLVSREFSNQGVTYRAPFTEAKLRGTENETWKQIRERGELVVSMDPANLPYSSADNDRPGFDVEIARALARTVGGQAEDRLDRCATRNSNWCLVGSRM